MAESLTSRARRVSGQLHHTIYVRSAITATAALIDSHKLQIVNDRKRMMSHSRTFSKIDPSLDIQHSFLRWHPHFECRAHHRRYSQLYLVLPASLHADFHVQSTYTIPVSSTTLPSDGIIGAPPGERRAHVSTNLPDFSLSLSAIVAIGFSTRLLRFLLRFYFLLMTFFYGPNSHSFRHRWLG